MRPRSRAWLRAAAVLFVLLVGGEAVSLAGQTTFLKGLLLWGMVFAASMFVLRGPLRSWVILVWREDLRLDLRAARRASGAEGRVHTADGLTIWTDQEGAVDGIEEALGRARTLWRELVGRPADLGAPLRVLSFRTVAAARGYSAGVSAVAGRDSYYSWPTPRVVLACEHGLLQETFVHELTHHLLTVAIGRTAPPWINEGLAQVLAMRLFPFEVAPGARARLIRATRARGLLRSGTALVSYQYAYQTTQLVDLRDVRSYLWGIAFYQQASFFVSYLIARHPRAVRDFLDTPRSGSRLPWPFERYSASRWTRPWRTASHESSRRMAVLEAHRPTP